MSDEESFVIPHFLVIDEMRLSWELKRGKNITDEIVVNYKKQSRIRALESNHMQTRPCLFIQRPHSRGKALLHNYSSEGGLRELSHDILSHFFDGLNYGSSIGKPKNNGLLRKKNNKGFIQKKRNGED